MQKSLKKSSPSEVNPIYLSTDSKGIVLDASESFYYYTGKSKQQVIGFSIADFLSNKAIRENIVSYYEVAEKTTDSREFLVKIGSGRKAKTCKFKITQRKQKGKISFEWEEQQEEAIESVEVEMLRSFLSSNPKPVVAYLPGNGEIKYTNLAFSSLYGYSPEFVKGKPIAILHEPSIAPSFIRRTYLSKSTGPDSFVVTNIKADQSVFEAEVHTGSVVINDQKFALLYIDDISEKIKASRQKRLMEDLSHALQKQETLRRKLDSAIEVLRQFINWDLGELWLFSAEHKYSMLESYSTRELTSPLKKFIESTLQIKIPIDSISEIPAYKEQKALWVPDIRKDKFLTRSEAAIKANLKGTIVFPLLKENRMIGAIFLFSTEVQELNHSQFDILKSVMGVLASEIEHQKTIDQYRKFFELSGDLLCIGDLDGRFRKVNSSFLELLGYSEDELLGRSYYGFIHDDDKVKLVNISQRVLLQEEVKELELRMRKSDGDYTWLSWSAVYSPDHQLVFAAARDITDKKKVEEVHRELHEIIGHASEVIFKLDLEGRITFASPEFERLFAVNSTCILNLHFREVIDPEYAPFCEAAFHQALQTKKPVRDVIFKTRGLNGPSLWMNTSMVFVFDENNAAKYGIGLAQNITSQRETLKKLEAAEQRYAAFLENSSEAIWRIETTGGISIDLPFEEIMAYFSEHGYLAECNKVFCNMYGYAHPDEMNGMGLSDLMPITDENNIEYFRSFVESGFNLSNAESVEYDREGNRKFILNNLIGIIEDRQLIRIWGTQRDITNLRTAEKEVANREEQYRTLAENVPMLIVRFDKDIKFTYVNRAFEQLSKLESSFLVGKSPYDLGLDAAVCEEIATRCARVFAEGLPDNFTLKVESQVVEGKKYNFLLNLAPEHDENQNICSVILIGHEITSIIEAQEALIYKDQLLASITRIAGQLLQEENYRNTIKGALEQLGLGTKADRAFVFENIRGEDGEYYCSHTYEWCKENITAQIDNPIFKKIPFSYIEPYISAFNVEDICFAQIIDEIEDEYLKGLLVHAGVQSLLIAPIFVGTEFWGLVGFDDCEHPRRWSEVDEDILKTFASCLAAAIQRKRVEEVVLESEARFKHMADNAPVMIWVSDQNDQTMYVNKNWIEFTGKDLTSYSKDFWHQLVHPEDAKLAISHYEDLFSQHLPVRMEYRLRSKTGEFRWVIDQAIPRFLSDGTFLGYIGTVIDIHDRKMTEEKISYQARVMQEITEAIISTDLNFNVITWNKGAEKIHGLMAKDIIGKKMYEQIDYEYIGESREEALKHLFKYGYWSGEICYKKNGDRTIYLFSSLSFITNNHGEHIGLVEVQREITEKKKSEEALRISEERYRTVVNALSEGIMLIDQSGKVITSNKSAEAILGTSSMLAKINGVDLLLLNRAIQENGSIFPSENLPPVITLRTGTPTYGQIMGIHNAYGDITWLSLNTEPLFFSPDRTKPDAVVLSFIDITQKKKANEELAKNERQLREYSDRINNILDSITDGFIAVDNEMRVFLWNHVFEIVTGIKAENAIGQKLVEVFPDLFGPLFESFAGAFANNTTVIKEHFSRRYNKWFEISAFPSLQGLFIYFRDITKRKRQELLLALEKEVLELNAKPLVTLKQTVDVFLTGMERVFLGSIFSVVGLKDDGQTIETLSAPHLPEEFCEKVNGVKIGPRTGSCGTAMYLKQNVIVSDIANSELWADYRDLALSFNLKACWSFPILSAQNKVLATMAVYNTSIKSPSHDELSNIQRAVNILRIIIENKQSEEKIKVSNERYLLATMATNDAIWDWDMVSNLFYWGEGFHGLFGYKAGYFKQELGNWEKAIHPADKDRIVESIRNFIESNSQQVWQEEYRFRKADGKYVLVSDRGFLIYNQQGKVSRMVGSMQDITEKREMEKKLLKQEINKQKLVAQAVVDAQEKERSLIGKELHDNINQILSTAKLYLEVARNDEKDRDSLIDMSTQGISEAINEIRTISRSLVPSSIGDLGIVDTLQDLVESIKLTRKVTVEFHYNRKVDELLTVPQKLMLFRIAQEQINNVMKHANASNLIIELFSEEGMVNITISDDGQGFDPEQVKLKKGVGLSNISSRAEIFNGKVSIKSAPGKGCTLQINVPITNL